MNTKIKLILYSTLISVCCMFVIFQHMNHSDQKIKVNIGYQSITAQTWGALIMKDQKFFEKRLKERYPDKEIEIQWYDEMSGSVINNNMFAHKYQIGYMGDMACIINLYNGDIQKNYSSQLIAFDGKGGMGANQSILVSKESSIKTVKDLKGKIVSVPVGSSAHRMLLEVLEKYHLSDNVRVTYQDIPTACNMVATGKIDAMAAWEPYPTAMQWENGMLELVNGAESEKDYLAGIVVDKDWANENGEILDIFIESIRDSHLFIKKYPVKSVEIICKINNFSSEVVSHVLDHIKMEDTINERDRKTLLEDCNFLKSIGEIESFSVLKYVKDANT